MVAWLQLDGARYRVPAEGLELERVVAGPHTLLVGAEGSVRRELPISIAERETAQVQIRLEPALLTLTRDAIELVDELQFATDTAEPRPESLPSLEAVAALLRPNEGIELLRVEGHADDEGSSRYNLDLSQRRAEAVVERLVALGVARERLQALGTGEAHAEDRGARHRAVTFLVLVWSEDQEPPALP